MKIDKWLSNLPIRKRLLLLFAVDVAFWVALCAIAAVFMSKMQSSVSAHSVTSTQTFYESNHLFAGFLAVILILTLIFVLLLFYLTFLTIKSIVGPIEMLSRSAVLISEGVIEGSLSSNKKDELGQLARDMDKILKVLQNLCTDLRSLSENHNIAGDIYAKIDCSKYSGEYKVTTELLNGMIWQYIADARDVLYCINEYTLGNFNTQIRTFPGARAVANNISYGLRQSLVSLTKGVGDAVLAASEGNFEIKLDEEQFQGDWKLLASKVNRMLENLAVPIRETTDAMLEIYEGNLNPAIKGEFIGDFALIKTSVSNAVESISNNIKEISLYIQSLATGNMDFALNCDFTGDYSEIKEALVRLKETAEASDLALAEVSEQITTYAELIDEIGNLVPETSSDVTIDNEKDLFSVFEDMNHAVDSFTSIITIIENISYHANLIAHSASVEIARAGDNGKNFSFVSDELGSLAEMNGEAIAEAQNILENAQECVKNSEARVRSGYEALANRDAKELEQLISLLKKSSDLPDKLRECAIALSRLQSGKKSVL